MAPKWANLTHFRAKPTIPGVSELIGCIFMSHQPGIQNQPYQMAAKPPGQSKETSFDVDGNVETVGPHGYDNQQR